MKKEDLWNQYAKKNPSFNGNGNVTLSARGLRKMFDQTWKIAFESGFNQEFEDDGDDENEDYPQEIKGNPCAENIFKTIFGGR
jgi:hypothetical protein